MKQFYSDFGFIVSFLILILICQMCLGEDATNSFLTLVLVGMIVINSAAFIDLLQNSFKLKEGGKG